MECMGGFVCHPSRTLPRMAPVVSAASREIATVGPSKPLHSAPDSSAAVAMHVIPAREQIRMGRAVAVPAGMNWLTLAVVIFFHAGALAAFFFFSWQLLAVMAVLYILAINVGIGMCYHRLPTHRVHHQLSDHEGDPHTPREGGWWAHAGWILFGEALHGQAVVLARYSPDLTRDRFHVWLSKYHWIPITASGLLLLGGGWLWGGFVNGIAMVLWGVLLRVTLGLHATWLVNSATHLWGSRRFETHDDSRNNWWVALLTGGEGWHNNHHAHPVSARHGLKWYEIDPNFYGIWLMSKLGLAKKIRVAQYDPEDPKPAGMEKSREQEKQFCRARERGRIVFC